MMNPCPDFGASLNLGFSDNFFVTASSVCSLLGVRSFGLVRSEEFGSPSLEFDIRVIAYGSFINIIISRAIHINHVNGCTTLARDQRMESDAVRKQVFVNLFQVATGLELVQERVAIVLLTKSQHLLLSCQMA